MISKLKLSSLLLTFSIAPYTCLAADNNDHRLTISPKPVIISAMDILDRASNLYLKACNTEDPVEQIKEFDNLVSLMDLIIPKDNVKKEKEGARIARQLKVLCLKQQSTILYNLSVKKAIINLSDLQKSADLLDESYAMANELNDLNLLQQLQKALALVLKELALAEATQGEKEEDFQKSLPLFDTSIANIHKSVAILPLPETRTHLSTIMSLSLLKAVQACDHICLQAIELYQQIDKSNLHYKHVTALINLGRLLLDFTDKHYIKSPTIDFYLSTSSPSMTKKENGKKKIQKKTSTYSNIPPVLNPQDFRRLILTTYCGLLKEASTTLNMLANSANVQQLKDLYLQKGNTHLETAIDLYKQNIYQNDYENKPEDEQLYIQASLEDLADNPIPLTNFYRQLHKKRKEEQHQRHVNHIKAHLHAKKEKELKIQQEQEELLPPSKESKYLTKKNQTMDAPFSIPYLTVNMEGSSQETFKAIMPKEKIKTRGMANLPLSLEKLSLSSEKEEKSLETIRLSADNYMVFEGLTGGSLNRNISLHAVETLLASLHCTLSSDGKGVHQKATAPNGQMWIRPKPWKGPIPDYYRLQLNDFLQNKMGIDPEIVATSK
ncbi:MAG: hypothetical protein K0M45_06410 [Candidatus Paracaedibacteraceae bacterium]|nr:hypothetical protein [Candidatus Paracaedibacteraceae bacterium]